MNKFYKYYESHPLRAVLILGFLIRLISVIFSKGFGMHDDHFLVIEATGAWVDGTEYDQWLPGSGAIKPDGHSFFYSGLHFLFFHFLKFIGITDPQSLMFFVRLVHAFLSLGVIYFGFKIAEKLGSAKDAAFVGLLLAVFWFMPFLSVRNLIEIVCIPFLMAGVWFTMQDVKHPKLNSCFYLAGLLLGIGFCIRFQSILFIGGLGLGFLIIGRIKHAILIGLGVLSIFLITQAPMDYYIWGYPFAQFIEYVLYNIENATTYIIGPWYNYLLLISGVLIPPVSIFLLFGWLKTWKSQLPVFLAVFVFLAFHSYFPNKQERFILPIVPLIITFGYMGWVNWLNGKERSIGFKRFVKYSWMFFWVLNIILLPFITTMYSKRARVEAMTYLYPVSSEIRSIITEDTNRDIAFRAPRFYLGKWIQNFRIGNEPGLDSLRYILGRVPTDSLPDYILFVGEVNIKNRIKAVEPILPELEYVTTISPGFIDKVLYWLNPRNKNDEIYIYKILYN